MKDLNKFLEEGESILWSDGPNRPAWILSNLTLNIFFLMIFAGFLTLLIILSKNGSIMNISALIITLLVLGTMILVFIYRIYLIFTSKGFPKFYFTDRSNFLILSEKGGIMTPFGRDSLKFNLSELLSIKVSENIFEKIFGKDCRTIAFRLGISDNFKEIFNKIQNKQKISDAGFSFGNPTISFESIDHFKDLLEVSGLMNQSEGSKTYNTNFIRRFGYSIVVDTKAIVAFIGFLAFTIFIYLVREGAISGLILNPGIIDIAQYVLIGTLLLIILAMESTKAFLGLKLPNYQISSSTLRVFRRKFKIITKRSYQEIILEKIKKVWNVKGPFGNRTNCLLLCYGLKEKAPQNIINDIGQMMRGTLEYLMIVGLEKQEEFLHDLGFEINALDTISYPEALLLTKKSRR